MFGKSQSQMVNQYFIYQMLSDCEIANIDRIISIRILRYFTFQGKTLSEENKIKQRATRILLGM